MLDHELDAPLRPGKFISTEVMHSTTISIIVPVLDEQDNVTPLVERIDHNMAGYLYEIIFIDDHSTDKTKELIHSLSTSYPVSVHTKKGKKGKAQSLIEGFSYAQYDLLCMIDADLQYPPEAIPKMVERIDEGADVVVSNRVRENRSFTRRLTTSANKRISNQLLHQFDCDVQSGLKVFKKEIIERLWLNPKPWAFDLEFLIMARNAGYRIESYNIPFMKRTAGKSKISFSSAPYQLFSTAIAHKIFRSEVIPFHPSIAAIKGNGFHYKGQEYIHHSNLPDMQTAFHRLSGIQIGVLLCILFLTVEWLLLDWHTAIVIVVSILTVLYFADLLFNLYLIYRSFSRPSEVKISHDELVQADKRDWPSYSIFCPLYKEWQVIPQFVTAMSRLDYPKDRLQVMLLLEEDDTETIAHVNKQDLPDYFNIVVVPDSLPKTKPKACNYGLTKATGEYTVIYDAEDVPDTLQLKKAVLAFEKVNEKIICIQAKLNFYNPHQNLLTRVFAMEYSLWFDLVLTGLQSIHAPIPLGGTSNHFRTKDLFKLNGWDSFNVTEDCDLGMRLVKLGYKTAVMDSITLEEANSGLRNWFGQRSRWIKGYMQTYFVHMRNPKEFLNHWTEPHVITFQLVVGGKIMSMFINPLMWVITICYFAFRAHIGTFIESFFPTPVLYMGVMSLLLGNFLYAYYYMIGCAKHGHDELVKYVFLVPVYWLAMSIAAWVAFYKLLTAPHHWSKTKHGLHLTNKKTQSFFHKMPEMDLTNKQQGGFIDSALPRMK